MLTFARTKGVDVDTILRAIDLQPAALDQFDLRIPEASRAYAWVQAAKLSGDPDFGLKAPEQAPIGAFDALDYSIYFSNTLGEALDRLVRFHRVLCDAWAIKREVLDDKLRVRRVERTPPPECDAFFALLVLRFRQLSGVDFAPHEVRFHHDAPADASYYQQLFRCPVHFRCESTELIFGARDFELPVQTANPGVDTVIDRYISEAIRRLPDGDSFVERVRSVIARSQCGRRASLTCAARELHASPRTVQRRLGEHGTSFQELAESVRRALAESLVAEGRLSITEIAFLAGFSDLSGFRRSYKRWTGVTPSRRRAGLSG
jgi:AraC-like DNA-binding protein